MTKHQINLTPPSAAEQKLQHRNRIMLLLGILIFAVSLGAHFYDENQKMEQLEAEMNEVIK